MCIIFKLKSGVTLWKINIVYASDRWIKMSCAIVFWCICKFFLRVTWWCILSLFIFHFFLTVSESWRLLCHLREYVKCVNQIHSRRASISLHVTFVLGTHTTSVQMSFWALIHLRNFLTSSVYLVWISPRSAMKIN